MPYSDVFFKMVFIPSRFSVINGLDLRFLNALTWKLKKFTMKWNILRRNSNSVGKRSSAARQSVLRLASGFGQ